MKILITGGAGFIGSHLADALLKEGHEVFIIDNLATGRLENVPREAVFWNKDIRKEDFMDSYFSSIQPEIVVHAAASYKDPDDWQEDTNTNVLGTVNVVKQSIKYGVKRFIYLQTSLCYGPPQEIPITLQHPINPQNSYAISKVAAERYIMMSGLNYVSFRLANCYGPRNLSGPIPTFYKRLSEGLGCTIMDTRRDFVYIEELVEILILAVNGAGEGIYHVSSGKDYSIEDAYWDVYNAMDFSKEGIVSHEFVSRGIDDVETILLDPSRTVRDFHIQAKLKSRSLSWGIAEAVEWYKRNGVGKTYTHLKQPD